jgi:hypothetical protein
MDFHICIPVWHIQYYTRLVNFMIPSLLAPGNLPALVKDHDVTVHLLIPEADFQACRDHPSMRRLSDLVKMDVEFLDKKVPPPGYRIPFRHYPPGDEGVTHRQLMSDAHAKFLHFLPPDEGTVLCIWNADLVFSDGWCAKACEMLEEGVTMVAATPFCMTDETAKPQLARRATENGAVLAMPPRDLVAMAQTDPHPFIRFQTWGREDWVSQSIYPLNWEVPGNGWISHQFCHCPLAIRLDRVRTRKHRSTMDLSYFLDATDSIEEVGFFLDSDDGFCAELISYKDLHCPAFYDDGRSWTVNYLLELYAWTDLSDFLAPPEIQLQAFALPVRYHSRDFDDAWNKVESESAAITAEIIKRLPSHVHACRQAINRPRAPFPPPP